jgi:hypothetical protein
VVFGRKREQRSHGQQLMDELNESYAHLRLAAGHAAGGAAEKLTPTFDRASTWASGSANKGWSTTRDAFAPLYHQMRDGAANARKEYRVSSTKKNRWPMLVGLLAAGAAAGAVGAVMARRRQAAAQWDEYDPMPAVTGTPYGTESHVGHKVTASAASVADSVSAGAGKIAESLHDRAGKDAGTRPTGVAGMAEKAAGAADKASGKVAGTADKLSDKANQDKKP